IINPAQVKPAQVDPAQAIDDPIPPHPQRTYHTRNMRFLYGFKIDRDWLQRFHEANISSIKNYEAKNYRNPSNICRHVIRVLSTKTGIRAIDCHSAFLSMSICPASVFGTARSQ
ncbi:hypothetical protein H0H92_005915, partial [Tricholoma furcatifolium]